MADEQLDILIRTLADTHGAERVSQSLKRLQSDVKQTTAQTGQLVTKKRELAAALRAVGTEIPVLGRLTSYLFSPMTLAIGAVVTGFGLIKQALSDINDELESRSAKNWARMADSIKASRDRIAEYTTDIRKFNAEIGGTLQPPAGAEETPARQRMALEARLQRFGEARARLAQMPSEKELQDRLATLESRETATAADLQAARDKGIPWGTALLNPIAAKKLLDMRRETVRQKQAVALSAAGAAAAGRATIPGQIQERRALEEQVGRYRSGAVTAAERLAEMTGPEGATQFGQNFSRAADLAQRFNRGGAGAVGVEGGQFLNAWVRALAQGQQLDREVAQQILALLEEANRGQEEFKRVLAEVKGRLFRGPQN